MHGLILFAHGARDPRWAAPFEAVAARLRQARPGTEVRLAFLDFLQPGMPDAAAQLVQAGCRVIDIVPMFLGTGGHVQADLPRLVQALRAAHPQARFDVHAAIGEWPEVVDAMAAAVTTRAAREGTA